MNVTQTKEKIMQQVMFNQEVTLEDKYREFDVNLRIYANVKEERYVGEPTEVIVSITEVEVDDHRDVTPYENGQSVLKELDEHTIEWLKDLAVARAD